MFFNLLDKLKMRESGRERDSPCLNDKAAKKNPVNTSDKASGKDCTRDVNKVSI